MGLQWGDKMSCISEEKGTVLRIERSSIHDGEGLRTVVFMKGCPLKCQWCSTPESHNISIEKGYMENKCIACGICVESCPEAALSLLNNKISISKEKCKTNLLCYDKCPYSAWKTYGSIMSVEDLVKEITKDEIFFFHSDGGVTFSGGEPLLQSNFVAQVLKLCKRKGIHTAMESSLFAPFNKIKEVLPYLDALYVDIKHMDGFKHKKYTGVDNTLILDNILKIDSNHLPLEIYIRIPLIPTVNDSESNLLMTLEFCKSLTKLKEIELLPYHRLGIETYKSLGLEYKLSEIDVPTSEEILEKAQFMVSKSDGIKVRVGGNLMEVNK